MTTRANCHPRSQVRASPERDDGDIVTHSSRHHLHCHAYDTHPGRNPKSSGSNPTLRKTSTGKPVDNDNKAPTRACPPGIREVTLETDPLLIGRTPHPTKDSYESEKNTIKKTQRACPKGIPEANWSDNWSNDKQCKGKYMTPHPTRVEDSVDRNDKVRFVIQQTAKSQQEKGDTEVSVDTTFPGLSQQ